MTIFEEGATEAQKRIMVADGLLLQRGMYRDFAAQLATVTDSRRNFHPAVIFDFGARHAEINQYLKRIDECIYMMMIGRSPEDVIRWLYHS